MWRKCWLRRCGRGTLVVWDNLKPHHDARVIATWEEAGTRMEPLPPYSPVKMPIEEMFSKVKSHLRTVAARTVQTVTVALAEGLQRVTATDIQSWFDHRCADAKH